MKNPVTILHTHRMITWIYRFASRCKRSIAHFVDHAQLPHRPCSSLGPASLPGRHCKQRREEEGCVDDEL